MINLNDTTPPPPSGHTNVAWLKDSSGNVSANIVTPATGTVTHTGGALTANLPVIGAGAADVTVGTRSGNTTEFATVTGSVTSGHAATWDASGNLVDGGAAVTGSQPYDVVCSLPGKPGAGATVLLLTYTRTVSFPGNFSGSRGTVGVNPTATATYNVNKNGSSIGTIAVSTGGVVTFTTTGGAAQSFSAGDRMTVIAPGTQDATMSDVAVTFAGTR